MRAETLRLTPSPRSVGQARRFATAACRRWDAGEACDVVALLVSETVTNAVVHARSEIQPQLSRSSDALRVEVIDHSPRLPQPREARIDDEGGRGLELVDALAQAWGYASLTNGKAVWFEVAISFSSGGRLTP